jgi:hypothetical protein
MQQTTAQGGGGLVKAKAVNEVDSERDQEQEEEGRNEEKEEGV